MVSISWMVRSCWLRLATRLPSGAPVATRIMLGFRYLSLRLRLPSTCWGPAQDAGQHVQPQPPEPYLGMGVDGL